MLAIAQYASWDYEFVHAKYNECLQMLTAGQIDMMCNVSRTDVHERAYEFSDLSVGETSCRLVMHQDDTRVAYEDFEAIGTLRVGLSRQYAEYGEKFIAYCAENNTAPEIVWYQTSADCTAAFMQQQVDAVVLSGAQNVAVLKNTYIGYLTQNYYGDAVTYIECASAQECVDAVQNGNADVCWVNAYQASVYQAQSKYMRLNYMLVPEMQYRLSPAVSKSAPQELYTIISKAVTGPDKREVGTLFRSALYPSEEAALTKLYYEQPVPVIAVPAVLAAFFTATVASHAFLHRMKKKNAELTRAKSAESDFLSRMSHDIRTPLNGILGMTALARDVKNNPPETNTYLNKIDSSGAYLPGLVNDILDMNRIARGCVTLNPEPYALHEFETHLDSIIRPLCKAKNLSFLINISKDDRALPVDKVRCNQLFVNLLPTPSSIRPRAGMWPLK